MEVLLINFYLPWYPANLPVKLDRKKELHSGTHMLSIYLIGCRKFDRGHPPAQSNTTSNGDIFSIFYQDKSNVQK